MSEPNAKRFAKLLREYPDMDTWDAAMAREFSYRLHVGEVPKGYVLTVDCNNDLCVNPAHICCVPDDGPGLVN